MLEAAASAGSAQWQRLLALVAAYDREQRRGWGVRFARIYGWAIALAYAVALVVLRTGPAADRLGIVVVRGLGQLSLVAGALAALEAARRAAEQRTALRQLLVQRAYAPRELRWGALLAAIYRVGAIVGAPALVLAGLGLLLSNSGAVAGWHMLLLAGVAAYVVVLAVVLGGLAYWCAGVSPERPRLLLAGVVLGPELASRMWHDIPSVPALFERLLGLLLDLATRT